MSMGSMEAVRERNAHLVATFEGAEEARDAASRLQASGFEEGHMELVPQPTSSRLFDTQRFKWGAGGLAFGVCVGGALGALFGLFIGSIGIGAMVGVAMLGVLGLLFGLAIGEPKATREAAAATDVAEPRGADVILTVDVPTDREPEARRLLESAGASHVALRSHSPWAGAAA